MFGAETNGDEVGDEDGDPGEALVPCEDFEAAEGDLCVWGALEVWVVVRMKSSSSQVRTRQR
jgi:hypothetical protein